jgi:ankyrin repeat protein
VVNDGNSPLHIATMYGFIGMVTLLLQNGTNVSSINNKNETRLHMLCFYGGHMNILTLLLQSGADVNLNMHNTSSTSTPLQIACDKGYVDTVTILIQYGADVLSLLSTLHHPNSLC